MMDRQNTFGLRHCTWIWLILMALTVVTYVVSRLGLNGLDVALGVLLLALIKGHLIGSWFMGLNQVEGIWRWIITIWLLLLGLLITIAFILAGG